jgi:2-polyprenyl-6-methoxyphenol hydroxylase-like FAD-dependent oxidoreductase
VSFGSRATSVDEHGRLVLEGGEVVEADVVIGADGAQSAVRRTLLGDTPPRYTGEVTWQR